mmetsp:Transcript_56760/g.124454  ORF Transcript_56760/g.124454 Transcript_56760/m.124454 type:complete len:538 (+) Transcript_56760:249-1862(+)
MSRGLQHCLNLRGSHRHQRPLGRGTGGNSGRCHRGLGGHSRVGGGHRCGCCGGGHRRVGGGHRSGGGGSHRRDHRGSGSCVRRCDHGGNRLSLSLRQHGGSLLGHERHLRLGLFDVVKVSLGFLLRFLAHLLHAFLLRLLSLLLSIMLLLLCFGLQLFRLCLRLCFLARRVLLSFLALNCGLGLGLRNFGFRLRLGLGLLGLCFRCGLRARSLGLLGRLSSLRLGLRLRPRLGLRHLCLGLLLRRGGLLLRLRLGRRGLALSPLRPLLQRRDLRLRRGFCLGLRCCLGLGLLRLTPRLHGSLGCALLCLRGGLAAGLVFLDACFVSLDTLSLLSCNKRLMWLGHSPLYFSRSMRLRAVGQRQLCWMAGRSAGQRLAEGNAVDCTLRVCGGKLAGEVMAPLHNLLLHPRSIGGHHWQAIPHGRAASIKRLGLVAVAGVRGTLHGLYAVLTDLEHIHLVSRCRRSCGLLSLRRSFGGRPGHLHSCTGRNQRSVRRGGRWRQGRGRHQRSVIPCVGSCFGLVFMVSRDQMIAKPRGIQDS